LSRIVKALSRDRKYPVEAFRHLPLNSPLTNQEVFMKPLTVALTVVALATTLAPAAANAQQSGTAKGPQVGIARNVYFDLPSGLTKEEFTELTAEIGSAPSIPPAWRQHDARTREVRPRHAIRDLASRRRTRNLDRRRPVRRERSRGHRRMGWVQHGPQLRACGRRGQDCVAPRRSVEPLSPSCFGRASRHSSDGPKCGPRTRASTSP
jgi:hypothetical protein